MDIESFPDEQRQKGLSNSKPPHYRQKARGNNYRTGKIEVTREKFGKLKLENPHRERELRLFLDSRPTIDKIPITQPLGLTDASLTSRSLILPYSITGLSFAVNNIYNRFFSELSNYCTIFQLFRYALVQLKLQRF